MLEENKNDVDRVYDFHPISGHFNMLNEPNIVDAENKITSAQMLATEAKSSKGTVKTITLSKELMAYASALTSLECCEISDEEGLLCFICVRYPELDLDWMTMQKILHLLKTNNIDYQEQKTLELALTIYISAVKSKITQIKAK